MGRHMLCLLSHDLQSSNKINKTVSAVTYKVVETKSSIYLPRRGGSNGGAGVIQAPLRLAEH